MPYTNIPQHLQAKLDRCVEEVMKTGQDKEAVIAVCYATIVEAPRRLATILHEARGIEPKTLTKAQTYTSKHEAIAEALQQRDLVESGARHTQREFEIIQQVIKLMTELYGEIEDLGAFIEKITSVTEAIGEATVVDYLISRIHQVFTQEADDLVGERARLDQAERIFLSHAIGVALDAFNTCVDTEMPALRDRLLWKPLEPDTPPVQVNVTTDEPPEIIAPPEVMIPGSIDDDTYSLTAAAGGLQESAAIPSSDRDLVESVLGQVALDAGGNLQGIVVVEGRSANGNVYTEAALQTVPSIFAGAQIFVNHPTLTEEMERPEGDLYDLVGRLPTDPTDFTIDIVEEGHYAGRKASFFRHGFLSETADWLKTKIREGLAGDMSIRAQGRGHEEGEDFVVEAFTLARSLDFVTRAAAGGRGQLLEASRRIAEDHTTLLQSLTLEQLVEARPDLVAALTARAAEDSAVRATSAQEAHRMTQVKLTEAQKKIARLMAALRQSKRDARKTEADRLVGEALAGSALPAEAQTRVRSLIEAQVKAFIEAPEEVPVPESQPAGELAPTGSDLNPGDPATIELPPDVGELPAEAQAIWLESYVTELPKGEERAVNLAWAAIYAAGWVKGEQGWSHEQVAQPAMPAEPALTAEALRTKIQQTITSEKEYLAKMTEAGKVSGLGSGSTPVQPTTSGDAQLTEAYKAWGLTEAQVKVAVSGR